MPEVIIQPDWRDPHDQQFMELSPQKVRGGLLGLLACYNVREQTIDFQFAGSVDGRIWSRPSRQPTLAVSPLGDYGGGMLWPTRVLIEHEGRQYMYYAGLEGLHADTSFGAGPNLCNFYGAICMGELGGGSLLGTGQWYRQCSRGLIPVTCCARGRKEARLECGDFDGIGGRAGYRAHRS